jgi:diguanylate cyclase (GGDEF)-like protein
LTGLPNRALFYIHLRKAIARVKQANTKIAVLFIDLDGFKLVNDTFGHSNGDLLLIEVGNRISQNIRETDLLSRWGGDEFTMILENIREKADVEKIVSDLLYNISREITISGERISIGASVGIAIFPDVGDSIEEIMINADKAMYTSKANGKNCYTFATGQVVPYEIPKIIMINRLKRAIASNAFHLVYQPQIAVEANHCRIFGAEALIRWTDGDGQTYLPEEFISLAEETGMINALGQWVIDEACQMIREMEARGIRVPISINVSVMQFKSYDLVGAVKQAVEKYQIDPKLLYMEITENIFVEDELQTLLAIIALKQLGIKLVLDDFGKGYSSLGLISQLPFDLIKVDKSFTQGIGLEKEKKLAAMIISIGEVLNLQTIVEGVETREQVDFHGHNGGKIYQGYYFSKPLEKSDFIDLCLGKRKLETMVE